MGKLRNGLVGIALVLTFSSFSFGHLNKVYDIKSSPYKIIKDDDQKYVVVKEVEVTLPVYRVDQNGKELPSPKMKVYERVK